MLACDLFARGYNGETSVLYPQMQSIIGKKIALKHHFFLLEYREEFDRWYSKNGVEGKYDEVGEPILIENSYFENSQGERWYIDSKMRVDQNGNATFSEIYGGVSETLEIAKSVQKRFEKNPPVTEQEQRLFNAVSSVNESFDTTSYYNESYGSNRVYQSDQIWASVIDAIFLDNQTRTKFWRIANGEIPDEPLPISGMVDPELKTPETYMNFALREIDRFQREQDELIGYDKIIKLGAFLSLEEFDDRKQELYNLFSSDPENPPMSMVEFQQYWISDIKKDNVGVKRIYDRMTQKIGSSHKTIRQNWGQLYRDVADEAAKRGIEGLVNSIYKNPKRSSYDPNYDPESKDQKDIGEWQVFSRSITDFGDENLLMQRLGHKISEAAGFSENEVFRMKNNLNAKMKAVQDDYWKRHPREAGLMPWLRDLKSRTLHRITRHNEPFLWLFEQENGVIDPNSPFNDPEETKKPNYTGKLIRRFSMTEEQVRELVYGKDKNGVYLKTYEELLALTDDSDDNRNRRFLTSREYNDLRKFKQFLEDRSEALKEGVWLDYKDRTIRNRVNQKISIGEALTQFEQEWLNEYNQKKGGKLELTEKQQRYLDYIETASRQLVGRVLSVQEDSDYFKNLEAMAANGNQEARNRIELYDFLNKTNMDLLESNNNTYSQPFDRGIMPQVSMNMYEAYMSAGFMPAYIRFVANLDDSDIYNEYSVEHKGETKTWLEWREYYESKDRTRLEKLKAPFVLREIYKKLQTLHSNGKLHSIDVQKTFASSFSVSNAIPFKTLSEKNRFSVNASRIFLLHYESLIFRKHHNPLVPLFQAAKTHYENRRNKTGRQEDFKNVIQWIQDYSDRYFFGQRRGVFSNTIVSNMVDQLLTVTVLSYLSFSPETSILNLGVGMSEALKQKFATHGWSSGFDKFAAGIKRMTDPAGLAKNKGLNPKAKAFIEHYNLETFTNIDIENQQDFFFGMADFLMIFQQKSELMIRGTSILGELSEKEWNSFSVDKDGNIQIIDKQNFPNVQKVKEWNYYVSSVQGNYTPEGRRNYHNFVMLKAAMLFKTWMFDFVNERFRPQVTDMYGMKRQGYYLTLPQVLKNYAKVIFNMKEFQEVHGKLEEFQKQNLRKIMYDLSLYTLLAVALSMGDEKKDHPALNYLKGILLRYQTQLYFNWHPLEVLKIGSRPFPAMGMVESWVGALVAITDLNFGKSGELIMSTLPGHRMIDFTFEVAETIDPTQ